MVLRGQVSVQKKDANLGHWAILKHMHSVLDLDLDFFVWPVFRGPVDGRPTDDECSCASPDQVRTYVEKRCGLSRGSKLPGHLCKKHDEAFDTWRGWRSQSTLDDQFSVDHLDGHSDLSFGDASWSYVFETLLSLPPRERANPERGVDRLNEGSYLTFAIANRWIERLTYVYPTGPWDGSIHDSDRRRGGLPPDLNRFLFKDRKVESGLIELLHVDRKGCNKLVSGQSICPLSREPQVPIELMSSSDYLRQGLTHMILAHSEEYCPKRADVLIDVLCEYFYEA